MDGPLAASSLSGASPTSSEWQLAPFHHPPVISAHLLAPTSLLCKTPTSSGGNLSLVHYPPLAISAIEASLEPILVRPVVASMVLLILLTPVVRPGVPTNLDKFCHRAIDPTNLTELCQNSTFTQSTMVVQDLFI